MLFIASLSAAALITSVTATKPPPSFIPGLTQLAWHDDFSGSGDFDKTKWEYYNGTIENGELEAYPSSGEYCKLTGEDTLLITPTKIGNTWNSCRIQTTGKWAPPMGGKIQFAASFKIGSPGVDFTGLWPAFWSLGDSMRHGTSWPECGEIDTFEYTTKEPLARGTLHCDKTCQQPVGNSAGIEYGPEDFGNYTLWSHVVDYTSEDWREQSITFYKNQQPYHVIHGSDMNQNDTIATMQKAMYMTLNVAVGGAMPLPPTDSTTSGPSAGMEVEYVAVYQTPAPPKAD